MIDLLDCKLCIDADADAWVKPPAMTSAMEERRPGAFSIGADAAPPPGCRAAEPASAGGGLGASSNSEPGKVTRRRGAPPPLCGSLGGAGRSAGRASVAWPGSVV